MPTCFEYAGLQIEIDADPAPRSPREDLDLLGRLVFWHPTAILGDELPLKQRAVAGELARSRRARLWLPLWVLKADDKPMLRLGRSEDADADSADGLIYATARAIRDRLRLLHISRRAMAEAGAILRDEVENYVQFIRHEMLQFTILDQAGEAVDRGGGFYTESYAAEEARWRAEYHASNLIRYAPQRLSGPSCQPDSWLPPER
jgi:hypothetical protein